MPEGGAEIAGKSHPRCAEYRKDCSTSADLHRAARTPLPSDERAPPCRPGWGIASDVFEPRSKSQMNEQLKKEEEKSDEK
jgi:hypothetical protein